MLDFITVPFGYVMRLIYQIVGNYGLSIICFSLLTKLIMLPLSIKTKKSMLDMQRVQPKINELQKRYGKDQQKLSEELQKLYAEEGISPFGSCLPTLLTLPIMMGLYYVISKPLTYFMGLTADEITKIGEVLNITASGGYSVEIDIAGQLFQNFDKIAHVSPNLFPVNFDFFGMNLAATPNFGEFNLLWIIPILSGLTGYLYNMVTRMGQPQMAEAQGSMKMMNIMMPLMSVYFGFILPAGLGVYWIANNVFMAVQDLAIAKVLKVKADNNQPPLIEEKKKSKGKSKGESQE